MKIDESFLNQLNTEVYRLNPEHSQSVLVTNNQLLPQGFSYCESKSLFDVTENFSLETNLQPTILADLPQLIRSSVHVQRKNKDLYNIPDWVENSKILPVSIVQNKPLETHKAFEKQEIALEDDLLQGSALYIATQTPLKETSYSIDNKINIIDASSDTAIKAIDGRRLIGITDVLSIQNLIQNFYTKTANLSQELKEPITIVHMVNGIWQQSYQGGVIIYSDTYGIHTIKGSILSFYQRQDGVLGLPLMEQAAVSYGWRQDFEGGTVIHSTQYGLQLINGIAGDYYRSLPEAQRTRLGAPYTSGNNLDNGDCQQFFQGGIIECKSNGVTHIKFTPFLTSINSMNQSTAYNFQQYQRHFSAIE